jgi:hypothetical protein
VIYEYALRARKPRVPRRVVIDGPVVTFENAAGMLWLQDQFLM